MLPARSKLTERRGPPTFPSIDVGSKRSWSPSLSAVVGRVGVRRAHAELHAHDDVGVAQPDARAALRLLDVARADVDGPELVEGAAVVPLAVLRELHEVVLLDLRDDVVGHSDHLLV